MMQMQPELDAVFALTKVRAQLRLESGATNLGTPDAVAFANVNHDCRPTLTRVVGVLARTQVVDGVVQSLIEIDCAKLATDIRSAAGLAGTVLLRRPGGVHQQILHRHHFQRLLVCGFQHHRRGDPSI
jgi:hypothetical protein